MIQRVTTLEQCVLQLTKNDNDKERRLRFLERIALGAAGAYTLFNFWIQHVK